MKRLLSILTFTASLFICCQCSKKEKTATTTEKENSPKDTPTQNEPEAPFPNTDPSVTEQSPEETVADLGMTFDYKEADEYIAQIAKQLENADTQNDLEVLQTLLGNKQLSEQQQAQLRDIITEGNFKLNHESPFSQIGELQANKHARWSINLENNSPIVLDVKRDAQGNWKVEKITLPDSQASKNGSDISLPNAKTDALNYTHTFLTQLLKQDFETAKSMVDATNITDAKLAGLCIIFEEAEYSIDPNKPLRALFLRDTAAGFYANVISNDNKKAAQFSLIAQRETAESNWKIYEINLDSLLGDYAKRVSGGDVHYTPLLKNPQGGDTLVIYFEFDSEGLTERTQKQLSIVTNILKIAPNKTITISGHADALGGADYNIDLSKKRADSVKEFFINNGVQPSQVLTEAHGAIRPRRPNTNSDGSDNPDGRRANRRTEIYLDF